MGTCASPQRDRARGAQTPAQRWRDLGEAAGTIARHREDHILHYRKALVRQIEAAWRDAPFRGLILLGEHETLAVLRAALPPLLASQVIHEMPHSWVGRQPSITAKVQEVLAAAPRAHDDRLMDEVERQLVEKSYCVAAGPQEVIDALRNGQVGYPGYLVLES